MSEETPKSRFGGRANKKTMRVALFCTECGARNYPRTRSPSAAPGERIELKKFCSACGKHTLHKESK